MNFKSGCNYWASEAATFMWRDWDKDRVERDFRELKEYGMDTIRLFPLWPDFQPITKMYKRRFRYYFKDGEFPDTEAGRCGIDETMMEHFDDVVELAEKYGFKLIVGLLTGFMSGKTFAPPALEGMNLMTDSIALKWEIRFVKYFVSRYAHCPTIIAWEFGNECNNMQWLQKAEDAWLWSNCIADAIRLSDPMKRPVYSGLHGLSLHNGWTYADQGDICDVVTVHPYSIFTPHCHYDKTLSIRPMMHSVCEAQLYSDLCGRPCMVEEIGTIGGSIASDNVSGDFMKATVYSAWAHNFDGYLWWCAYDYDSLTVPPYNWTILERGLGLITEDHTPKAMIKEYKKFKDFAENFKYPDLPERQTDCCILLGDEGDSWANAFNSYVLAKQAGMDPGFGYVNGELPESDLYLVPGVTGCEFFLADKFEKLMKKVEEGATLFMSMDSPFINGYEKYFGVELLTRYENAGWDKVTLPCGTELNMKRSAEFMLKPLTAEVLAYNDKGLPCYIKHKYGNGTVYLFTYPLEMTVCTMSNVNELGTYHKVYAPFAKHYSVESANPEFCITRHGNVLVGINYSEKTVENPFKVDAGVEYTLLHGNDKEVPPFETVIIELK